MKSDLLLLIHHTNDPDIHLHVGLFTSLDQLYRGWREYTRYYLSIEKREIAREVKLLLGMEELTKAQLDLLRHHQRQLRRMEKGSWLCPQKYLQQFVVLVLQKNTIHLIRTETPLCDLFPQEDLCQWCVSGRYYATPFYNELEHEYQKGVSSDEGEIKMDPLDTTAPYKNSSSNPKRIESLSWIQHGVSILTSWLQWIIGLPAKEKLK